MLTRLPLIPPFFSQKQVMSTNSATQEIYTLHKKKTSPHLPLPKEQLLHLCAAGNVDMLGVAAILRGPLNEHVLHALTLLSRCLLGLLQMHLFSGRWHIKYKLKAFGWYAKRQKWCDTGHKSLVSTLKTHVTI